jgi:Holliday junction resolvase-like predicted endonuclease
MGSSKPVNRGLFKGVLMTFLKQKSISRKILEFIKLNGGISSTESKSFGLRKTMDGAMWRLYKRDYVKRFEFSTNEGFIYYLDASQGFQYGLNRGLIPLSVRLLYNKIEMNGAISSLELRDHGIPSQEIDWFFKKLVKSKILKSTYFGNFLVFYNSEEKLKAYLDTYSDYLKSLEGKLIRKFKRQGRELEQLVGDYYKSLGFNIERNKFFTNSFGEHIEIDIIATRPEIFLTIAIECKNYKESIIGPSILLKISKIKSVMPRAIIHVFASNISYQFFHNKSFWHDPLYRDVFLFGKTKIKEIYQSLQSIRSAKG